LRASVADIAANVVALEDAYGLHIVGGNSSVPRERAQELVLRFLETQAGCSLIPDGTCAPGTCTTEATP
jgi:hypothetical protein